MCCWIVTATSDWSTWACVAPSSSRITWRPPFAALLTTLHPRLAHPPATQPNFFIAGSIAFSYLFIFVQPIAAKFPECVFCFVVVYVAMCAPTNIQPPWRKGTHLTRFFFAIVRLSRALSTTSAWTGGRLVCCSTRW